MRTVEQRMEAQLRVCGLKIDAIAAKTLTPGVPTGFETLMRVDELKALYAIAISRFAAFRAAGDGTRERLEAEAMTAWNELDTALKGAKPRRNRRKTKSDADR
jgi:hypothetical protein